METIKEVLMRRDGMSAEDADECILWAKEELVEVAEMGGGVLDAEKVVEDWFGLEPDYLVELLD